MLLNYDNSTAHESCGKRANGVFRNRLMELFEAVRECVRRRLTSPRRGEVIERRRTNRGDVKS